MEFSCRVSEWIQGCNNNNKKLPRTDYRCNFDSIQSPPKLSITKVWLFFTKAAAAFDGRLHRPGTKWSGNARDKTWVSSKFSNYGSTLFIHWLKEKSNGLTLIEKADRRCWAEQRAPFQNLKNESWTVLADWPLWFIGYSPGFRLGCTNQSVVNSSYHSIVQNLKTNIL